MQYHDKVLCVSFAELSAIMPLGTLKSLQARGRIKVVNRGGGEGNFSLFSFNSLPERYQKLYIENFGTPDDVIRKQYMTEIFVEHPSILSEIEAFEYNLNGVQTSLNENIVKEIYLNANVLECLIKDFQRKSIMRKRLNNSTANIWDIVLQLCEQLREVYGHTLPGSLPRLKSRISKYKKGGWRTLISGKIGNKNTLKITEEARDFLVALKRSRTPVHTDAQIFDKYNAACKFNGWKELKSKRSLTTLLNAPEIRQLWYDAVFGELAAHQKFDRKHHTQLPTLRDTLWYSDGTKLNFYYKDEFGKIRTKQVYEIMDAYSEVLLGYHISDTEDFEAQYRSFRMALLQSNAKPYELVFDNQGGHKKLVAQGFFEKVATHHHTTRPHNGSSKTIEAAFNRFQSSILHKEWFFTGQNITAKKESSRANLEFIEANADKLPTLEEATKVYLQARDEWNNGVHPATGEPRMYMYENCFNPHTAKLDAVGLQRIFWLWTDQPSTFTQSGITITIKGKKYTYEVFSAPGVPDYEFRRQHTGRQFAVEYDPFDFSSIRLHIIDKAGATRFCRVAEPYFVIHRAMLEQSDEERAFIFRTEQKIQEERIDRIRAGTEIAEKYGYTPEQNGLRTPIPKGVRGYDKVRDNIRRERKIAKEREKAQKEESIVNIATFQKQVSNSDLIIPGSILDRM